MPKSILKIAFKKREVLFPNPISEGLPERYRGEREKRIVNFCRLEPQKNLKLRGFLRLKNFSQRYPDYKLEIYGSGRQENELRELIKKEGIW